MTRFADIRSEMAELVGKRYSAAMTIAACYLSSEGVVFGADSTTTMYVAAPSPSGRGAEHHFDFGQKIFQIGIDGTLGITTWGLGSLGAKSYRTLIAEFADEISCRPSLSMQGIAEYWSQHFWTEYSDVLKTDMANTKELLRRRESLTDEELFNLEWYLQNLFCGFCIGGCLGDRVPHAFEVTYSPDMETQPTPTHLTPETAKFWGCPNLIERLLYGMENRLFGQILDSGHWNGTQDELFQLVQQHFLGQPGSLPIREAIDWVHASIFATIKTMKFSHLAPVCGGPIEVAAITTDRQFRWVRHKKLDAAITHDGFSHD